MARTSSRPSIRPPPPPFSTAKKKRKQRKRCDSLDSNGSSEDSSSMSCVDSSFISMGPPESRKSIATTKKKLKTSHTTNNTASSSRESSSASSSPPDAQNVRVVSRLRPLSSKEIKENSSSSIQAIPEDNCLTVAMGGKDQPPRRFEYDAVFGPQTSQEEMYERTAGDMIKSNIFKGFNVTILAYGQTGSGKTFTMGTDGGSSPPQPSTNSSSYPPPCPSDGIIPRAVHELFHTKSTLADPSRVTISMSYLEIYNEEVRDLLSSTSAELVIRDSRDGTVVVQNLSKKDVNTPTEVTDCMKAAGEKRATASTAMNAVSSRSHAICTLVVTIAPDKEGNDEAMSSKLTLVDLAGSERIKRTGAEGTRMKEGININKGLFVLGQVVSSLSEIGQSGGAGSNAHIPYRDSKLTRLLQDSLGGNSRTVMVACVSPADSNVEESLNTLRYASRTRNIKNAAVKNVVATAMSPAEAAALRRENQLLKLKVMQLEMKVNEGGGGSGSGCSGGMVDVNEDNASGVNVAQLEIITRLRATNTSLATKVSHLEDQLQSAAEDSLTASFQSDQWQLKYERLAALAKEKGVDVDVNIDSSDSVLEKQRKEIEEMKSLVKNAQIDVEMARATAAAVVAGNGDLTHAEEMALMEDDSNNDDDDDNAASAENDKLTSELVGLSSEIEQKERMVLQMNKERQCMDSMRSHFENAIKSLQDEVDALSAEKQSLQTQLNSTNNSQPAPDKKKSQTRISQLETKISLLQKKLAENAKSLRLRTLAERKCAQLAAEINNDKKRRAALQKKLKESATERRAEKALAKKQATQLLRDKSKLAAELQKVKRAAEKRALVLRRKAAEAIQKQKQLAELQRKKKNAMNVRLNRFEMARRGRRWRIRLMRSVKRR